ncbi:flagellin modification protein FlmB [Asticcacaulis sp. AC466]|uniref:UDP-4-amino-4, 6-dideoxy-N-acetyl-beta-L-altrosamine transaminase n=1 Tax=Asticcacaulis sp. AC466 TaxID=1282362 RepID=UPI0003C3E1D2|nr:UDP-4-amino-4,6-dideoxy-N-acetyl-beta-L-altrosamine transaminase [Asticcacaulis sp. AC466]ESQ85817.1 flagellin modification protein FlmB [Asticcacaulis sp. AC466]
MTFLPYGRQSISEADIAAVADALRSDFLTTGPLVERFEKALAEAVGAAEAVVVSNGTAALHLAVMSEQLSKCCVVIVPAITFAASANCVAYCGAEVVFADVDPVTGLITDDSFDEALNIIARDYHGHRFAGVIPVHYAGRPVDLRHLRTVCDEYGAFIIEDACHAIGTVGPQGPVGSCQSSNMACFSFHPVKTLTTGEGGAVTTNDPVLAARLRTLRSHGIERDPDHFVGLHYEGEGDVGPWVYEQQCLGYNYRLPDINCALGLSQLKRLPEFAARRKALVRAYQAALDQSNIPVSWMQSGDDTVFHLFAVNIDFAALGTTRARVMAGLRDRGIGSQVHYIPVHRQPYWQRHALGKRDLPGADAFYQGTLSLPLYAEMSDEDPVRVISALSEVL